MKKLSLLIIVVALLTTLISCNNSTPSKPTPVEQKFTVQFDDKIITCYDFFGEKINTGSSVTESDRITFTAKIKEDEKRVDYWTISNMEKDVSEKSIDIEVGVENAIKMSDGTYIITAEFTAHDTLYGSLEFDPKKLYVTVFNKKQVPGEVLVEGRNFDIYPILEKGEVIETLTINKVNDSKYYAPLNYSYTTANSSTIKDGKIDIDYTVRKSKETTVTFDSKITVQNKEYYSTYCKDPRETKTVDFNSGDTVYENDRLIFTAPKEVDVANWILKFDNSEYVIPNGYRTVLMKAEYLEKGPITITYKVKQ